VSLLVQMLAVCYVRQMNRVNSCNGCVMMTAPASCMETALKLTFASAGRVWVIRC